MLVFLAPEENRLPDLEQSIRLLTAWTSIVVDEQDGRLNIDSSQRRQAETRVAELENTVSLQIREVWCRAIVPTQPDSRDQGIEWTTTRLQGQDPLAVRAGTKLVSEESFFTRMGPARLKLLLDNHLWQDADHLNTKKLWEFLANYLYLPRLRDITVLSEAIHAGINELVCDHFAYAERYDEETGKYQGLKTTGGGSVVIDSMSVVVQREVARRQVPDPVTGATPEAGAGPSPQPGSPTKPEAGSKLPKRFFGTVSIDSDRAARDMGKITEEILQHLTVLPGAKMQVTVEITAEVPDGVPEETQRVVNENSRTLKFDTQGFEKE